MMRREKKARIESVGESKQKSWEEKWYRKRKRGKEDELMLLDNCVSMVVSR